MSFDLQTMFTQKMLSRSASVLAKRSKLISSSSSLIRSFSTNQSTRSGHGHYVVFEEIPLSEIHNVPKFSQTPATTIGVVTINKPEKMNALCPETAKQFRELFLSDKILKNPNLGAIVLTGASSKSANMKSAFSAGGDFDFLLDRCNDVPFNNSLKMLDFYNSFLEPLLKFAPCPTISALNGAAVGAGLAVAMATDIRLAESSAKLGVNFVNIGLSPGMASTYFLPHLLGHQTASVLLLTGDLISAQKALDVGMVYEVVDGEQALKEKALDFAARIARNPQVATKLCLKNLRMQQTEGLERMLIREADCQAHSYAEGSLKQTILTMKSKTEKKK